MKSWIFQQQSDFERAGQALNKATLLAESEDAYANILYEKYLNSVKSRKYEDAVKYTDSLIILQSDVIKDLIFNSVDEQKGQYYKEKAEQTDIKVQDSKKNLSYFIIILIGIIIFLIMLYKYKERNKRIRIENTLTALLYEKEQAKNLLSQKHSIEKQLNNETSRVHNLKQILDKTQLLANQKNITIESLFRNQWKTLNLLCDEYYEKYESETTRNAILKNIEKEINNQRSPKNLREIESSVNLYMDDIMKKLRNGCPSLNDDELNFVMLNYAGLSIRAICLFNNIKYKTFHNKKTRIVNKIYNSDIKNKEVFLRYLNVNT